MMDLERLKNWQEDKQDKNENDDGRPEKICKEEWQGENEKTCLLRGLFVVPRDSCITL
jgi:hypothetical protein